MNIEVHIHEFTDKILSNINLYKSPMDFSVLSSDSSLPPEIKRLDKSSIKVLKESIHGKKMLDHSVILSEWLYTLTHIKKASSIQHTLNGLMSAMIF